MKVYKEIGLDEFKAWGPAVETLENVRKADKIRLLELIVEDMWPEGVSAGSLNDYLAYETDHIYNCLGLTEDGELPEDEE